MKDFVNKLYRNHALIYKVLLFVSTVFLIVYLFPKSGKFKYNFEKGKPWQSENLYAPFDFAINKTKAEIDSEKEKIKETAALYFNIDTKIKEHVVENYDTKFEIELADSIVEQDRFRLKIIGLNLINKLYVNGVLNEDYNFSKDKKTVLLEGRIEKQTIVFSDLVKQGDLKNRIQNSKNIAQMADMVGLSSPSRVYDLFVNIEGVTPATFKNKGAGLTIHYGYHDTPFGECFIAATEKGLCGITFLQGENKAEEFILFTRKWDFATLIENATFTQSYIEQIFNQKRKNTEKLTVLVQGTPFQIKVWEALINTHASQQLSYSQVSQLIDSPKASRAVGTALANNTIGYLIPCHRVIKNNGELGHYRWGIERKTAMLAWEQAQLE